MTNNRNFLGKKLEQSSGIIKNITNVLKSGKGTDIKHI